MRRLIETAPRDGTFVILEDDAGDNYDVARWSSEAERWVGENGEPVKIAPTHWYPTDGEDHLPQGLDFPFFLRRAGRQRATVADALESFSVPAGPVTGPEVDRLDLSPIQRFASQGRTALIETGRIWQARWRLAAILLAASLVAAAVAGTYFGADLTYEMAQLKKAGDTKAAELQQERDRRAALENELARVRGKLDTVTALLNRAGDDGAQLRKVADTNAAELQQERDRRAALEDELTALRRNFDTVAALLNRAGDDGAQLRKVADANASELQQERDQRVALASELATVRRDFDTMAALLSKAGDEEARLRKVAEASAAELQQERDQRAALASQLAAVRRDLDAMAAESSKVGDEAAQPGKVAEARAAELQQESDHAAPMQGRTPAAGAPVAAAPARKLDPDELAALVNRAKSLVAAGDISSARLLFERAAEAREPTAALMLARTYDPDVLRTENVRNIIADPAMARIWYERAAQLGSADAERRLSEWGN